MLEDRLDDVSVVVDPELIGNGEEQRVCFGDGLVHLELRDEGIWLGGVAAAEDGTLAFTEHTDLVALLAATAEIHAVALVDQREDAAGD